MDTLWEMVSRVTLFPHSTLTCDECVVMLAYLLDMVDTQAEPWPAWRAAQRHLARCPDCRECHAQYIRVLEAYLIERSQRAAGRDRPARSEAKQSQAFSG